MHSLHPQVLASSRTLVDLVLTSCEVCILSDDGSFFYAIRMLKYCDAVLLLLP
jgi:hypothetical protein